MFDWSIIIQVLNTIIILVIGFIVRSYLPKYFEKKGENKAVKEDIGEITKIDESVRSKIGEIRAIRDIYNQEQKEVLLNFYDLLVDFFYEKIAVNFGDFPVGDGESIAQFNHSFIDTAPKLLKSYQRIVIYFESDAKVRVSAENALNEVLQARKVMKNFSGKLIISHIKESEAMKSGNRSKIELAVKESDIVNDEYWNSMKPIADRLRVYMIAYLTELNKFLRPSEIPNLLPNLFQN
jgi:hypothetical protein